MWVWLQIKKRRRKVETCGFGCKLKREEEKWKHVSLAPQKWFWANIRAHFAEAGKEN